MTQKTIFKGNTDITSFEEFENFNGVKYIHGESFFGCTNLRKIKFPVSLENIQDTGAFRGSGLEEIDTKNVTYIGNFTFADCPNLRRANCPNVTYFRMSVFENTPIEEFTFSDKVERLGGSVFRNCKSLTKVSNIKVCSGGDFEGCSALVDVNFSEELTRIASSEFLSCSSIETIYIPDSVTSIGEKAFQLCTNLTNVSMPSSITLEKNNCFNYCDKLKVTLRGTNMPSFGSSYFGSKTIFYVDTSMLPQYQSNDAWSSAYSAGRILAQQ